MQQYCPTVVQYLDTFQISQLIAKAFPLNKFNQDPGTYYTHYHYYYFIIVITI